jgi:hypothetical protein
MAFLLPHWPDAVQKTIPLPQDQARPQESVVREDCPETQPPSVVGVHSILSRSRPCQSPYFVIASAAKQSLSWRNSEIASPLRPAQGRLCGARNDFQNDFTRALSRFR